MSIRCNHCEGTGFLNLDQIPPSDVAKREMTLTFHEWVVKWIDSHTGHDVTICDCCGNGETWYGEPGEHYNSEDPPGPNGPYSYNGGLAECH